MRERNGLAPGAQRHRRRPPAPAGPYAVETDEEPIVGLSFMAYRRVATVIFLPLARGGPGSFQAVPVDPPALEAAILADKAAG